MITNSLKTKWDAWSNCYHYEACIYGQPDGPDDYIKDCDCIEIEGEFENDAIWEKLSSDRFDEDDLDILIGCNWE